MPGYLVDPATSAAGVMIVPLGTISSDNVQSAVYELDNEKATTSSVTTINNTLTNQISSVEGIALMGL